MKLHLPEEVPVEIFSIGHTAITDDNLSIDGMALVITYAPKKARIVRYLSG